MKLINSFKYAVEGIISSFKSETNMKIHCTVLLLVVLCGILFKISYVEWIICIILFGLVIACELFNTAIETVVDLVMPEKNEKAKLAKDVSAGAVLIISLASVVVGLLIFIPKIFNLF